MVLYCTLLAQAQSSSEKEALEKKMSEENDLKDILKQLKDTDKEDAVQEERERRKQARQSKVQADMEGAPLDDSRVSTVLYFIPYIYIYLIVSFSYGTVIMVEQILSSNFRFLRYRNLENTKFYHEIITIVVLVLLA